MLKGVWGRKIGMTQVFSASNKVVPVTVIDVDNWLVTNIKTKDNDGYDAVQCGSLRKRYVGKDFSQDWLKKPQQYFSCVKEVKYEDLTQDVNIGQPLNFAMMLTIGQKVDVFGITKGKGFQGVVKRLGYSGGRASHGPRFGRWPGSLSFMRSQGRVIKGKGMPGHMGTVKRVMKKLEVVRIEAGANIVLVKGSVPGGSGSLVFIQKA